MRLCARAEKSSGDARRLMRGWGLSPTAIEQVLRTLLKERFVDDARYARAFVREKSMLSGWGAYKIRVALRRKEVKAEIVEEVLAEIDPAENRARLLRQLLRKTRTLRSQNQYDTRNKLLRYGLSLGYDYEMVREVVSQQLESQNELCDDIF